MKNNKISRGVTPLYLNKGKIQVLLAKEFWANKEYIMRNYNARLEVW